MNKKILGMFNVFFSMINKKKTQQNKTAVEKNVYIICKLTSVFFKNNSITFLKE